jgi:type I restriction enzyme S subunit
MINNSIQTAITGINTVAYFACPIVVPPLPEQTAIATILSDMETEITALETKLAKTRSLKQGMMQELLTGKTRLI